MKRARVHLLGRNIAVIVSTAQLESLLEWDKNVVNAQPGSLLIQGRCVVTVQRARVHRPGRCTAVIVLTVRPDSLLQQDRHVVHAPLESMRKQGKYVVTVQPA